MAILTGTPEQIINTAAELLLNNNVVALPTETVYGLAADITQEHAIAKIYQLKNRPSHHPLIVHIANEKQLLLCTKDIPDYAFELIQKFWPGPLTLVLNKSDYINSSITGQQNTVAIRMPSHPLTLAIIEKIGRGVAAPSANKFGRISPTQPQHVIEELGNEIAVVDGGGCYVGIESTIINATNPNFFSLLRPGHITSNDLTAALKHFSVELRAEPTKIRVSGQLNQHYAPQKPLALFSSLEELEIYQQKFKSVYVIYYSNFNQSWPLANKIANTPAEFARQIYSEMRRADKSTAHAIAIERPPNEPVWLAINDRLNRSAEKF